MLRKVKGMDFPCNFTKESGRLIEIVSTSREYGKLMSLIIENIFEDGKLHPKDYLHILYDTQMTELFKTLGKILKLVIFKITFLNYQYYTALIQKKSSLKCYEIQKMSYH